MSLEEMMAYIQDRLVSADEYTIQQIFDYLQEVEYRAKVKSLIDYAIPFPPTREQYDLSLAFLCSTCM